MWKETSVNWKWWRKDLELIESEKKKKKEKEKRKGKNLPYFNSLHLYSWATEVSDSPINFFLSVSFH